MSARTDASLASTEARHSASTDTPITAAELGGLVALFSTVDVADAARATIRAAGLPDDDKVDALAVERSSIALALVPNTRKKYAGLVLAAWRGALAPECFDTRLSSARRRKRMVAAEVPDAPRREIVDSDAMRALEFSSLAAHIVVGLFRSLKEEY